MKKILILGYILAVLILSGMVKADGTIQSARVNSQTGILNADGYMPNGCYIHGQLAVSSIEEDLATITLFINSERLTQPICPEVIIPFIGIYDLRDLPLTVGKTYKVQFIDRTIEKAVYSYTALPKIGSDYKIKLQPFKGIIVYVSNPLDPDVTTPGLKRADQIIPVVSPDMAGDLKKFENQEVRLSGYAVQTATLNNESEPLFQTVNQPVTAIIPVSVGR